MIEGWKKVQVLDICTKGSSNIAQNKIEDNYGEYPLYGASGFLKKIDFYHQEKPYIGIVKDGSGVGRVGFYPAKSSLLGTLQYILPKEGYDIRFVGYALKSLDLASFSTGAAIPHIYFKDYGKSFICVPPTLEEQERIVDELDLLTGIIDKKNAQLRDLDALAQSIFYEMFGDPETLRLKNTLGEVCSIVGRIGFRGYTRDDFVDGPEYGAISLSPANIINSEMNYDKCSYITWEKYDESPEIMIEDGDILVVKTGSSYGKTALVEGLPHKATINPQFVVLKQLSVDNEYLTAYLSTPFARRKYEEFVIGTAIPTFSQKKLASMPLLIPSTADQKRFSSAMSGIRNERRLIKQALEDNKSLLNSRMDFYFTD